MIDQSLRITEIFHSLQGETSTTGLPTTFVRLTGCPLRCSYCDTEYAFYGGSRMSLDEVLQQVDQYPARYVTVTGGEPLAQPNAIPLLKALCDRGYRVSLETSGALSTQDVDPRVVKIVDFKTPSSGELGKNLYDNLQFLNRHDEVKFVIGDRQDYDWVRMRLDEWQLEGKVAELLFSPVNGKLNPRQLAEWILIDGLNVRLQVQLHKQLWNDQPGH